MSDNEDGARERKRAQGEGQQKKIGDMKEPRICAQYYIINLNSR